MKAFVGITGASGAAYAVALLRLLREREAETWVALTRWGAHILREETGLSPGDLGNLASVVLDADDMARAPASGSGGFSSVAIIPCTVSTAGKVACGIGDNLVTRAAGVALKEKRRLVVVIRETPLSAIHLDALAALARAGAVVLPASPAFYSRPGSVEEIVEFIALRTLSAMGVDVPLSELWEYE